jgi:gas vesicle protein
MNHNHKNSGFGMFLAGVVSAVLMGGYLFFGSKKAKSNRKKVEWWLEQAKEEVTEKLEKVKDLTKEKYDEIADSVFKKYSQFKNMKKEKIDKIKDEIRKSWEEIDEEDDE